MARRRSPSKSDLAEVRAGRGSARDRAEASLGRTKKHRKAKRRKR